MNSGGSKSSLHQAVEPRSLYTGKLALAAGTIPPLRHSPWLLAPTCAVKETVCNFIDFSLKKNVFSAEFCEYYQHSPLGGRRYIRRWGRNCSQTWDIVRKSQHRTNPTLPPGKLLLMMVYHHNIKKIVGPKPNFWFFRHFPLNQWILRDFLSKVTRNPLVILNKNQEFQWISWKMSKNRKIGLGPTIFLMLRW